MTQAMHIFHAERRRFGRDAFLSAGLADADATTIAGELARADLRELGSHGASRIPMYLGPLDRGSANATPDRRLAKVAGA